MKRYFYFTLSLFMLIFFSGCQHTDVHLKETLKNRLETKGQQCIPYAKLETLEAFNTDKSLICMSSN